MASVDLDSYRWRNRLLLVFAESRRDTRLEQQTAMWRGQERGVEERDMVLMLLLSEEPGQIGQEPVSTNAAARLRRRTGVPAEGFAVVLIGKDGGVKLRSSQPVSTQEIFARIDAMPMRRSEMRREKGPAGT